MAEAKPEALVAPTDQEDQPFKIPAHLPQPPFIDVDGIPNFRDVGGYECFPSGLSPSSPSMTFVVRPNFLFRCAHPTQITEAGKRVLSTELGVKAMFDLRSAPEVTRSNAAAKPSPSATGHSEPSTHVASAVDGSSYANPIPGAVRYFTPVFPLEDYSPESFARKMKWYSAPDVVPTIGHDRTPYSEGFLNAYREIFKFGVSAYTAVFKHILNHPEDPFVFHCTAGKDRTGVLAVLILRLVGVADEVIVWEYAITEPGLGSWRDMFIQKMTAQPAPGHTAISPTGNKMDTPLSRAGAARICGSRAGTMRAFLHIVLDGEVGGAEKYLTERCGFTDDELARIRRTLVQEVDTDDAHATRRPVDIAGWSLEDGFSDIPLETNVTDSEQGSLGLDVQAGREKEEKVMIG